MSDIDATIGRNIRSLRTRLGFDQSDFGSILGWGQNAVSKIENGKRPVRAGELWALAVMLDVPVSWFYQGFSVPPVGSVDPETVAQ